MVLFFASFVEPFFDMFCGLIPQVIGDLNPFERIQTVSFQFFCHESELVCYA